MSYERFFTYEDINNKFSPGEKYHNVTDGCYYRHKYQIEIIGEASKEKNRSKYIEANEGTPSRFFYVNIYRDGVKLNKKPVVRYSKVYCTIQVGIDGDNYLVREFIFLNRDKKYICEDVAFSAEGCYLDD